MELIANLGESRHLEGLTPENVQKLEEIFKSHVGDNNKIDFENFKKIVQSKNTFFVERLFNIFDVHKSGTVSLEEFMGVIRNLANQLQSEKLHYLFKIYDLNGDGMIQMSELRNVISECMTENGLKFKENEIDELTQMLFEDADTDSSGNITFAEFKNQVERHPGFMENLTSSIERWLLPPKESRQLFSNLYPRQIQWKHIRNNWTNVLYLTLYFLTNLALFVSRAYEYRTSNVYVILARACGQCLNFNSAFVLLLILRQTLTWLRTHGLSEYFPIDQHLYYHKLTGFLILFYSLLHTAMHIANFSILSKKENKPLQEYLISTKLGIGWVGGAACLTGWILLAVLIIMVVTALPFVRRNGKFEIFYCLHQLAYVFWLVLILHGPNFWKWFLGPALLYILELTIRINRNLSTSKKAYVQQGILLPSKVTQLVIKRPPNFDYRPGDYVYINIPAIAIFEWHPFTISSAPELDDVLWLHIRGVGEWTNRLHNYFEKVDKEAVLSKDLAQTLGNISDSSQNSASQMGHLDSDTPKGLLENQDKNAPQKDYATFAGNSERNANVINKVNFSDPTYRNALSDKRTGTINPVFKEENPTVIEMENVGDVTKRSIGISLSADFNTNLLRPDFNINRRTSFTSTSTSRAIQRKNREDIKMLLAEQNVAKFEDNERPLSRTRLSLKGFSKQTRKSVRVSIAKRGLSSCQTVIVMPTVGEDEEEEQKLDPNKDILPTEEEIKDLNREIKQENIVIKQEPLKIFLDGPYGSPTRHIFQAKHAVLIGSGIGITPFASILQSIMYQYKKSRHACPSCNHKWSDPIPVSSIHLKKVDFFWLNRNQRAFEWFVNLLSELEIEQAQLEEKNRFLDIHMYITSASHQTDMKAVGLQMALDLLYEKEKRDLITGLKSRTQPGRPDWNKVFTAIADQRKGKVTVFFCGPNQLAKTLQTKCDEFGFRFRKETF